MDFTVSWLLKPCAFKPSGKFGLIEVSLQEGTVVELHEWHKFKVGEGIDLLLFFFNSLLALFVRKRMCMTLCLRNC